MKSRFLATALLTGPILTLSSAWGASAFDVNASENFGFQKGTCLAKGDLGCASHGDYVRYDNIDFGKTGARAIRMSLAVPAPNANQRIEVRTGSPSGKLVGTIVTKSTGGENAYRVQEAAVDIGAGSQSIFLVFPGTRPTGPIDNFVFIAKNVIAPAPPAPPAPPTPPPVAQPTTPSCSLLASGPVRATKNGHVIENLYIKANGQPAISIDGYSDVVIRNVRIEHQRAPGISFDDAPRLSISDVSVVNVGAPADGPLANPDWVNIDGDGSADVQIKRVKVEKGASGIRLLKSPRAKLSFIEGHDFRGPFPRGQFVQFDASHQSTLEDFSSENGATSWVEDNISVFNSSDVQIRRGLVDGNNSPSGIGVMFEQVDSSVSGGLAEDIDAVRMGNGCFSGYPARDVIFNRTRCADTICSSQQGRGKPLSNSLAWAGEPTASRNLKIRESAYRNLCNPNNTVWDRKNFTEVSIRQEQFVTRAPQRLNFCWDAAKR